MFHNLQNYDSNLTFQEIQLCKYNFEINIIPKIFIYIYIYIYIYTSFTVQQPKGKDNKSGILSVFIDNVCFLNN